MAGSLCTGCPCGARRHDILVVVGHYCVCLSVLACVTVCKSIKISQCVVRGLPHGYLRLNRSAPLKSRPCGAMEIRPLFIPFLKSMDVKDQGLKIKFKNTYTSWKRYAGRRKNQRFLVSELS